MDEGYTTRENILIASALGVDLMWAAAWNRTPRRWRGARRNAASIRPIIRKSLPTTPPADTCTCPQGKPLAYETTKRDRVGVERKVYKARAKDCRNVPFANSASRGGRGGGSSAA